MKILVDELPDWRGNCPFAEEKWASYEWTYTCKLNYGDACNLNEIEHEFLKLKEVNSNES